MIDNLVFYELNKHTSAEAVAAYLAPLAEGESVGVISEAGCPAVADPGADVVAIAQRKGYKVVPLVGPSSILMSVMGSGLTGRACFSWLSADRCFTAYECDQEAGRAHLFGEPDAVVHRTPYRNNKLAEELIRTCRPRPNCVLLRISLAKMNISIRVLLKNGLERFLI